MNLPTTSCNGLQQWQELFDEKVSKVYTEEPLCLLKNLSMILFTIDREMKKIQDALHGDALHIRNMVIDVSSESDNKHSSQEDTTMLNKLLKNLKQSEIKDSTEPSPNKGQAKKVLSPNNLYNNILTTDCESNITMDSDTINTSPELKNNRYKDLKRKLRRKRKLDSHGNPTKHLLNGLRDSVVLDDSSFKENNGAINASLEFLKHNEPQFEKDESLISNTPEQLQIKVTPRKSEDFDFSVIQSTPVLKSAMSIKSFKSSTRLPRRKTEKKADLTLTQMLISHREKTESAKRLAPKETNCDNSAIERSTSILRQDLLKTSQVSTEQKNSNKISALRKVNGYSKVPLVQPKEGEKTVGITMMVDLLNEESTKDSTKDINTESNLRNDGIKDLVDSLRYEDFEDESSLNSGMLDDMTNIETAENSCQNLNDFLAVAQDVSIEMQAPPIVRGKARQKLPGWACKECEKFYTRQGLGADEILALNKCTKHRGVYKPREDTLPGFWDMDLRTQE